MSQDLKSQMAQWMMPTAIRGRAIIAGNFRVAISDAITMKRKRIPDDLMIISPVTGRFCGLAIPSLF